MKNNYYCRCCFIGLFTRIKKESRPLVADGYAYEYWYEIISALPST